MKDIFVLQFFQTTFPMRHMNLASKPDLYRIIFKSPDILSQNVSGNLSLRP